MRKFRLGTTSYVIPDEIMPNVRFLAGRTEDIELILFEVEEENQSNLPSEEEMAELNKLAEDHDLTYTIHLPLDLKLAAGGSQTQRSLRKARRVIHHVQPLQPFAFVLHIEGYPDRGDTQWIDTVSGALEDLAEEQPLDRICVENLEGFPEAFWDPLFERVPVGRCIDIGHLWVDGLPAVPYLEQRLERTRIIHLHGLGARDHKSLQHMERAQVEGVLEVLIEREYDGVVTLEMFDENDVFESIRMITGIMEQNEWGS